MNLGRRGLHTVAVETNGAYGVTSDALCRNRWCIYRESAVDREFRLILNDPLFSIHTIHTHELKILHIEASTLVSYLFLHDAAFPAPRSRSVPVNSPAVPAIADPPNTLNSAGVPKIANQICPNRPLGSCDLGARWCCCEATSYRSSVS
jgi:hypothetical protein